MSFRLLRPVLACVAAMVLAQPLLAQSAPPARRPARELPGARLPRAGQAGRLPPRAQATPNNPARERQIRQAIARLAKQRIGLTDAQMAQLGPINQRFEGERRRIIREERQTRLSLRQAMQDSAGGNQDEIARHMDRLIQLQRERVDLLDHEQQELAKVMTPAQRAKYMVFQENVRRRFEQAGQQNVVPDTTGQP